MLYRNSNWTIRMTKNYAMKMGVPDYEFRLVLGKTRIEYDADKERANCRKHGYSLESAAYLLTAYFPFLTRRRIFLSDSFLKNGEMRHQHLVEDDNKHILFIATTMRPDETIRVISLRPASEYEHLLFEELANQVNKLAA